MQHTILTKTKLSHTLSKSWNTTPTSLYESSYSPRC